jgi:nitrite reductase (NADH) small subunit
VSTAPAPISTQQWVMACHVSDIPARGGRVAKVGELELAIFRLSHGGILAVENRCPHRNGKLSEGIVADHTVICPLHGWRINLVTGEAVAPDKGCVAKYPVDIREGAVYVDVVSGASATPSRPLADAMGTHPDNGRPKLGRRRAQQPDFTLYDFSRDVPVLAVEPPSPTTEQTHQLQIVAEGKTLATYSIADLGEKFEAIEVPTHITCVMFGFTKPVTWRGVRLADVIAKAAGSAQFNFASFFAWDTLQNAEKERFFETLKKDYVLDPRTLLVFGMNGRPLPPEHGGPLRLAAPFLQGYKSVKWLTEIKLCDSDDIGFKKRHGFIEFPEFHPPPEA